MRVVASLSPLSRKLIESALTTTYRRYFAGPGAAPVVVQPGLLWDDQALVGIIAAQWQQPPQRIARLLGAALAAAPDAAPITGKAAKALKESAALLAAQPQAQARLRGWHDEVMAMAWSQAQLLQVMEEIELYVNDAIAQERRLTAAVAGSYAHLFAQVQPRLGDVAAGLLLDLVAGLPAPQAALIDDLAAGQAAAELRRRYGHFAAAPLELAQPRFGEVWPFAPAPPLAAAAAWAPARAASRRQAAVDQALAAAGLLHRPAWRQQIAQVQALFTAQAAAQEGVALVMAAARRWCLAAAQESRRNDRIDQDAHIFLLELEEIKQLMTGEWHSREQVQRRLRPRLAESQAPAALPAPRAGWACSGGSVQAPVHALASPAEIADLPAGAIALVPQIDCSWAPLYLRCGGIIVAGGDLCSPAATLGRSGGVPTLLGGPEQPLPPAGGLFHLDPAHFPL